ncbi:MAG: helix-turn-helix transcriptional regulator [Clostridiales bacterium]|nr:helix-turn-helix transcriptional regulator [Clostridiales bacterium]
MKKTRLNKNYIGAEIRGPRAKFGNKQIELSQKAKIDLVELKKIENGFKMPNLEEIVNICNFYKISTQEFLEFKDVWIAN